MRLKHVTAVAREKKLKSRNLHTSKFTKSGKRIKYDR